MNKPAHAPVLSILAGVTGDAIGQQAGGILNRPFDSSDMLEGRKLVESIEKVERDERCVRRMAFLTGGITALAAVRLGYGLILQHDFAVGPSIVARIMSEIALASLFSFVALVGLWLVYRSKLNRLLRDCRRLVTQLIDRRQQSLLLDRSTEEDGKV